MNEMQYLTTLSGSGANLTAAEPDGVLYKLTSDVCSSWFPGEPRAECASLALAYLEDHVGYSPVILVVGIAILAFLINRNRK